MELTFEIENSKKNTSKGKIENTRVGDGFFMVRIENQDEEPLRIKREIDKSLIQFYFAVQGGAEFLFNNGNNAFREWLFCIVWTDKKNQQHHQTQ